MVNSELNLDDKLIKQFFVMLEHLKEIPLNQCYEFCEDMRERAKQDKEINSDKKTKDYMDRYINTLYKSRLIYQDGLQEKAKAIISNKKYKKLKLKRENIKNIHILKQTIRAKNLF